MPNSRWRLPRRETFWREWLAEEGREHRIIAEDERETVGAVINLDIHAAEEAAAIVYWLFSRRTSEAEARELGIEAAEQWLELCDVVAEEGRCPPEAVELARAEWRAQRGKQRDA